MTTKHIILTACLLAVSPLPLLAADGGLFSAEGVDRLHAEITDRVTRSAAWLDAFFVDPVYDEEQNDTRVRLRLDFFAERGESPETDLRVDLRLQLPGTRERWSLFVSGDGAEELDTEHGTPERRMDEASSIGLSYFLANDAFRSFSVSGSIKRRDGEYGLFVQPRYRRLWEMGDWNTRFTQKIGYHTETRFETESRLDVERLLGDDLFFRVTGEVDWEEEQPGIEYASEMMLRQLLDADSVLSYRWYNQFETQPEHALVVAVVGATLRKRFWRRWMFYEIAPYVAFPDDRDYRATPGMQLRFEMLFGRGEFGL